MNAHDKNNDFTTKPTTPSKETITINTETKGTIIMQPSAWEQVLEDIGINLYNPKPKN